MDHLDTKDKIFAHLNELETDIKKLANEKSLATLEHKLNLRQKVLEYLFEQFIDQLNEKDMDFLRSVQQEIHQLEEDLKTIDYLFENYNLGMNVFRTARGGRAKFAK